MGPESNPVGVSLVELTNCLQENQGTEQVQGVPGRGSLHFLEEKTTLDAHHNIS